MVPGYFVVLHSRDDRDGLATGAKFVMIPVMGDNTGAIPAQVPEQPAEQPDDQDDGFTFVGPWMAPMDEESSGLRLPGPSPVPRPGLLGSLGVAVVALGCVAAVVWHVSGTRSVTALDEQSVDGQADVVVDVTVDATGAEAHCALDVSVQVDTRAGATAQVRTRVQGVDTTVDSRAQSRSRTRSRIPSGKATRRRLEMKTRQRGPGEHSVDVEVREFSSTSLGLE